MLHDDDLVTEVLLWLGAVATVSFAAGLAVCSWSSGDRFGAVGPVAVGAAVAVGMVCRYRASRRRDEAADRVIRAAVAAAAAAAGQRPDSTFVVDERVEPRLRVVPRPSSLHGVLPRMFAGELFDAADPHCERCAGLGHVNGFVCECTEGALD